MFWWWFCAHSFGIVYAHVGLNPKRKSVYAHVGLGIQSNFIVHRDVPVWTFAMCVLAKVHLCVWPVVVERNYN